MQKILLYRWKAYTYTDIIRAFQSLGIEVHELASHMMNYETDDAFAEELSREIDRGGYAFVFSVNYFPLIAEICHAKGMLYVSWSCDSPLISMHHRSVFYDTNRIVVFDRAEEYAFSEMGVRNIRYLPLSVDLERSRRAASLPPARPLPADGIVFIGRLYRRNSYDRIEHRLPQYLKGYLEGVMASQADLYGANILDSALSPRIMAEIDSIFSLRKSAESFSDLKLIFETTTLGFKIAELQRTKALHDLSARFPRRTAIYTTDPLENLPLLVNRGQADYWNEGPYIYHHAKISLNMTIPNIRSGIPLRVWDILGACGFCLTNFQPEMEEYFRNREDLVWFRSEEEMLDLASYYIAHDSERERIRENGLKKIAELGDTKSRIEEILTFAR